MGAVEEALAAIVHVAKLDSRAVGARRGRRPHRQEPPQCRGTLSDGDPDLACYTRSRWLTGVYRRAADASAVSSRARRCTVAEVLDGLAHQVHPDDLVALAYSLPAADQPRSCARSGQWGSQPAPGAALGHRFGAHPPCAWHRTPGPFPRERQPLETLRCSVAAGVPTQRCPPRLGRSMSRRVRPSGCCHSRKRWHAPDWTVAGYELS